MIMVTKEVTYHQVALSASRGRFIGMFIEANFSKLTHNNQILRNEFVCSQNHFSKISAQIVQRIYIYIYIYVEIQTGLPDV